LADCWQLSSVDQRWSRTGTETGEPEARKPIKEGGSNIMIIVLHYRFTELAMNECRTRLYACEAH
jgi:hypothetical protein